ncbi:L,D-transpeptidase family protein [Nonomuraea sp. NPDC049784]|uniref:L,D-transpeptidase family protein n=1 Tax=Nonomuraea sp. NPDC049784 TaxID=3154361 RepID=UPI0033E21F45
MTTMLRAIAALVAGCALPLLAVVPALAEDPPDPAEQPPVLAQKPPGRAEEPRVRAGEPPVRAEQPSDEAEESVTILMPGARGDMVQQLQRRLREHGFYFGPMNGKYDIQTRYAVWGFQKSRRMRPMNGVGPKVWQEFDRPRRLRPLVPKGPADRVEINLTDQLLTVYRHRRPVLTSHVSTGAGVHYCEAGHCGYAITPVGDFKVYRRAPGWTHSPLGEMFNSLYFTGGIAMHGSSVVPTKPSSHGCVRIPVPTAVRLYKMVPIGEPVYVRGKI